MIRSVWRRGNPAWNQPEAGWRQRVPAFEDRLSQLEAGWRQHVPAFLNAVSSVAAFGHELAAVQSAVAEASGRLGPLEHDLAAVQSAVAEASGRLGGDIERLWDRIEFVRSEVLLEMKYGRNTPNVGAALPVSARIVNEVKVADARARGAVRLNMGCGHITLEGHINIDMRDLPGVDVVAEVGDMPFEQGSVTEMFSAHLLEHFPQEELRRRLLPYWKHLLSPNGGFRAVVPDGEAMLASMAAGTYSFEDFREVLFGAQDYEGDFHFNLFTPDSLSSLLEDAGFVDIEVPVSGRRNGKCFEFEIVARRA